MAAERRGYSRRAARSRLLAAGGALAALGVGVGTAAAAPQGQVGTEDRSVEAVHTAALAGPVTGGEELTSLVGDGLAVEDGALAVDGGN